MSTTGAAAFAAERPRLVAIAARILGSEADAEDVVQEAWLRLSRSAAEADTAAGEIEDLPAWLTTVVTRLCLDQLRRRDARAAAEDRAPEQAAGDPEDDTLLAARVGDALDVVLRTLSPGERAALVLHDVFGYRFDEVAAVLGRSEAAVRQLASRARRKVRGVAEPAEARRERLESRRVVEAFLDAARGGELATLLTLLAPDAVMRADLAGQAMGTDAAYVGAAAVAGRFEGARGALPVTIDGELGAAWIHRGTTQVVFVFNAAAGLIDEVELLADPDVLATLDIVPLPNPTTRRRPP